MLRTDINKHKKYYEFCIQLPGKFAKLQDCRSLATQCTLNYNVLYTFYKNGTV